MNLPRTLGLDSPDLERLRTWADDQGLEIVRRNLSAYLVDRRALDQAQAALKAVKERGEAVEPFERLVDVGSEHLWHSEQRLVASVSVFTGALEEAHDHNNAFEHPPCAAVVDGFVIVLLYRGNGNLWTELTVIPPANVMGGPAR